MRNKDNEIIIEKIEQDNLSELIELLLRKLKEENLEIIQNKLKFIVDIKSINGTFNARIKRFQLYEKE